jgi:protein SCO1/2
VTTRWRRVLVAVLCYAALWSEVTAQPRVNGVILDRPTPLQSFALDDHNGKPVTAESFKGRWSLVLAGFTHCPDVCPFTLANLEQVVSELGLLVRPDRLPVVVFLGVDPERDRAHLKDYVLQFHPDFLGVTGANDQIERALKSFDAVATRTKPDAHGSYQVNHSSAVAVVDSEGRLAARISPPFDPAPTAQFLADLIRRSDARATGSGR